MRKRLNGGPRHIQWSDAPSRKPPAQQCGGRRTAVHRSSPPPSQARCRRPTHAAGSASPFRVIARQIHIMAAEPAGGAEAPAALGQPRIVAWSQHVVAAELAEAHHSPATAALSCATSPPSLIVSVGGYAAPTISSHTTARAGSAEEDQEPADHRRDQRERRVGPLHLYSALAGLDHDQRTS